MQKRDLNDIKSDWGLQQWWNPLWPWLESHDSKTMVDYNRGGMEFTTTAAEWLINVPRPLSSA